MVCAAPISLTVAMRWSFRKCKQACNEGWLAGVKPISLFLVVAAVIMRGHVLKVSMAHLSFVGGHC